MTLKVYTVQNGHSAYEWQNGPQEYFDALIMLINPLSEFFSEETQECIDNIPPTWPRTGSWNHASYKKHVFLPLAVLYNYMVYIMGADVLTMQGSKASATMILTMLNMKTITA